MISSDTVEFVSIATVKPYPGNPRRGDIAAIAESLKVNGQYRPIVVNRRTQEILAGNHTWQAARKLGWKKIAVSYVDVDEQQAARIVLADNQIHERGRYNNEALSELLNSLPDLQGTGYDEYDVERLSVLPELDELFAPAQGKKATGEVEDQIRVFVGLYHAFVDDDVFNPWADSIREAAGGDDKKCKQIIRERIGFGEAGTKKRRVNRAARIEQADLNISLDAVETVPISSLHPFPENARRGAVAAIAESLDANGQYRPIVVNRPDNTILVGNHTWLAAKSIGWTEIAVCWVDVDEDAARKIVLADNRTAELGTYDDDSLRALLNSLPDHVGTGFTPGELRLLLTDIAEEQDAGWVIFRVGEWSSPLTPDEYREWERNIQASVGYSREEVCAEVIKRLKLPADCYTVSATMKPIATPSLRRQKAVEA